MGIKRLAVWNMVSMMNHIWNLFSISGSLWVAWVHANWLKGRSFWQVPIPQYASWSWKKILNLRSVAKQFLKHKVGDGRNIFLWFDNWHPVGCLLDAYGYRVMYDAGPIGPKLSSIIRGGNWYWSSARSEALVEIQSRLLEIELGGIDQVVWDSKGGSFSSSETWEKLRNKHQPVAWHRIVWFPAAIPKHSFVLWLVFHGALVTRNKTCGWGYMGDSLCLFCRACQGSQDHLFFSCSFSCRIWKTVMQDCIVHSPPTDWDKIALWSVAEMRGKSLKASIQKIAHGATVYNLWLQRNYLLHGRIPWIEEELLSKLSWEVKSRVLSKFKPNIPL